MKMLKWNRLKLVKQWKGKWFDKNKNFLASFLSGFVEVIEALRYFEKVKIFLRWECLVKDGWDMLIYSSPI